MNGIFRGWWVLLGVFLVYTANNGILLHTLPLFSPSLIEEYGWGAEQVTRPASVFFLVAAIITPFVGWLFDRYPAKPIMYVSIGVLLGALVGFPMIQSLNQMVAIYIVLAIGLAGCGILPNMLIVSRWFVRHRGIAVGVLLMGSSFGGAIFPLIVKTSLVEDGWRTAAGNMTIVGAVMMLGAMFFLVRARPQDYGLAPDGDTGEAAESAATAQTGGPTLQEAAQNPVFYILLFATGALWFCIVGLLNHQAIFMAQDLGVNKAELPIIFSVFFWCAIAGKLGFGWIADHFNKLLIRFLGILLLMAGLAFLLVASPGETWKLYGYAAVYGIGFSGTFAMIQVVVAQFFAGASYGRILGIFTTVDTLAGGAGIAVLGRMRDAQHTYLPAFEMLLSLCLIVAVLVGILCFRSLKESADTVTEKAV